MKSYRAILTLILVLILNTLTYKVQAQTSFKILPGSYIKVNGTSNLHNWSMLASNFNCEGIFILNGDQLQEITALNFSLLVENLKGKDDLMNTRAYKALKAEQFNKITFKLTNATIIPHHKIIKVTGKITIAGVTNQILLQSSYTVNDNNTLTCKGSESFKMKMSDFKIKAPSFMMGALKTGDEIAIEFVFKLAN